MTTNKKTETVNEQEMIDATPSTVPATLVPTPAPQTLQVETLLQAAIEKKVPVETMERLLAMRRELKAEAAKEMFDADMCRLQGALPIIVKDKKVDFTSKRTGSRTFYSYAPIDSIIRQTREIIARYGFSYAVTTEQTPTEMTAICTVKHQAGHAEATAFRVPLDPEAFMSGPQKVGAAMTFAKRYAFCNAFGIITGDEDNDATHAEGEPVKKEKLAPKPTDEHGIRDAITSAVTRAQTRETLEEIRKKTEESENLSSTSKQMLVGMIDSKIKTLK